MSKNSVRRIIFSITALVLLFCLSPVRPASAGEVDVLVDKLVEKGVLTHGEAQRIKTETKEELRKQVAQGELEGFPKWLQLLSVKGDLRLRHQFQQKEGSLDRHRDRVRFRLKGETSVASLFSVGFGLATGGTDPRSTNETLDNSFETPDIRLDYAYASYSPASWFTLSGGKFKNPLWKTSDLLWDSDINPDGLAAQVNWKGNTGFESFINGGVFLLDESSGDLSDPFMFAIQPGFKYPHGKISLKVALAYYGFRYVDGQAPLPHAAGTNTLDGSGNLMYAYAAISPSVELTIAEPVTLLPFLSLFADYVMNSDPQENNAGYLFGVKFGASKVSAAGQWQAKYMMRHLEKDAWLDVFPDSNAYSGSTGVEGHEVVLTVGLAPSVTLDLDFYRMENLDGTVKSEDLFQFDVNYKF